MLDTSLNHQSSANGGESGWTWEPWNPPYPDMKQLVDQYRKRSPGLELAASTACEAVGALVADRLVLRAALPTITRAVGKVGVSKVAIQIRNRLPAALPVLTLALLCTNNTRRYWDADASVELLRSPEVLQLDSVLMELFAPGAKQRGIAVRELVAVYICADLSPICRNELQEIIAAALSDAVEAAAQRGYAAGSTVPWPLITGHQVKLTPSDKFYRIIKASDELLTSKEWVSVPGLVAHLAAGALVSLSRGISGWKTYVATFLQLPAFSFPVNADPTGDFVDWHAISYYIDAAIKVNATQSKLLQKLWETIKSFFSDEANISLIQAGDEDAIQVALTRALDSDAVWCA